MNSPPSQRLLSLDVFRGITIAGMVLVNSPGSWEDVYPALRHSAWNGCTPTDLVFPFFLLIVGVSITLSLSKRMERGDKTNPLIGKILIRTLAIFALGVLLNGIPHFDLSRIRIPGVLQRIAVVYGTSSLLFIKTGVRTQAVIGALILFLYWGIMTIVPVPGVGPANLGPTTNLGAYIDTTLLGGHLWGVTRVWDPEGILSTLPAVVTGIAGLLLGHWLRTTHDEATKTAWIFVAAVFATVAGVVWDIWFPINKALWTSSYVLYTAGMGLFFFGTCYWLVDVRKITWWTKPFVVFGRNAIALYVLSWIAEELLQIITVTTPGGVKIPLQSYLYDTFFVPSFSPVNASLAWALAYVTVWLGIMWVFHARRIFVKI